jgi:hypothetical protein
MRPLMYVVGEMGGWALACAERVESALGVGLSVTAETRAETSTRPDKYNEKIHKDANTVVLLFFSNVESMNCITK